MKSLLFLSALLVACSTKGSPPKTTFDCSTTGAAEMAADCALRAKTECVDKGVPEADCEVLKECDAKADARKKECTK